MMKRIIFWGASGHAKVLRECTGHLGYELAALFDNQAGLPAPFPDVPLYYGEQGFADWHRKQMQSEIACLVAIGGPRGQSRVQIQQFLENHSLIPIVAIHPTAFVAPTATLGQGCQILAHATVGVEVGMGKACIINTAASVDHESVLADGVHIGPGATLTGCVKVGDFSMVGAGAVILPRITIGRNAIVGAGAVVTNDVPDNKVVSGNPARIMRENI